MTCKNFGIANTKYQPNNANKVKVNQITFINQFQFFIVTVKRQCIFQEFLQFYFSKLSMDSRVLSCKAFQIVVELTQVGNVKPIQYSTHSGTVTKNIKKNGNISGLVVFLGLFFFENFQKIAKCNSPGVSTVYNYNQFRCGPTQ